MWGTGSARWVGRPGQEIQAGLRPTGQSAISRAMLQEPDSLRFASEATIAGLWGMACLLAAGFTIWADRRRARRPHVDRIGWIPWPKLFFALMLVGVVLLTMAVKGWASAGG